MESTSDGAEWVKDAEKQLGSRAFEETKRARADATVTAPPDETLSALRRRTRWVLVLHHHAQSTPIVMRSRLLEHPGNIGDSFSAANLDPIGAERSRPLSLPGRWLLQCSDSQQAGGN